MEDGKSVYHKGGKYPYRAYGNVLTARVGKVLAIYTGSCFIPEAAGRRFAINCGMPLGNADIEKRNWDVDIYDHHGIEFILMTQAHMDHSGLLLYIMQQRFCGKVLMPPPTLDLLRIILLDGAYIQEMKAQSKNRKRLRYRDADTFPLYTQKDAMAALPAVTCGEAFSPALGHMLQARIAKGFKEGGSRYIFPKEIHPDLNHDHSGMVNKANGGQHTGSQWCIMLRDRY